MGSLVSSSLKCLMWSVQGTNKFSAVVEHQLHSYLWCCLLNRNQSIIFIPFDTTVLTDDNGVPRSTLGLCCVHGHWRSEWWISLSVLSFEYKSMLPWRSEIFSCDATIFSPFRCVKSRKFLSLGFIFLCCFCIAYLPYAEELRTVV